MFEAYGSYQRRLYSGTVLWIIWFCHTKVLIIWITATTLLLLDYNSVHGHVDGVHALLLSLQAINFAAEPLEMALWSYHLLEPWLYLTLQSVKAVMWTIFLPVGVIFIRQASIRWWQVDVVLYSILGYTAVCFYGSMAYAILIFMRHKKKSGYQLPSEDEAKGWRRAPRVSEKTETDSQAVLVPSQYT